MFKELEAIKARVKEMEEEAEKLKEMQKQVEETIMSPPASQPACKMKHCCYFYRNSNLAQPVLARSQGQGGYSLLNSFFLRGKKRCMTTLIMAAKETCRVDKHRRNV